MFSPAQDQGWPFSVSRVLLALIEGFVRRDQDATATCPGSAADQRNHGPPPHHGGPASRSAENLVGLRRCVSTAVQRWYENSTASRPATALGHPEYPADEPPDARMNQPGPWTSV